MLQQIVVHTPVWVWALLAFLVYRGFIASVDREVALKKTFIIPVVMLVLSIQGMTSGFGASAFAAPVWLASLVLGSALAWMLADPAALRAFPERGTIHLRGSWAPMMLMMGIFLTKYAVGVTLALHPALRGQMEFVASVCALYGLFSGIFLGKQLRIVAVYRQSLSALPA
jgi:hypothetical protein